MTKLHSSKDELMIVTAQFKKEEIKLNEMVRKQEELLKDIFENKSINSNYQFAQFEEEKTKLNKRIRELEELLQG